MITENSLIKYNNIYQSPIGRLVMESNGESLTGLRFDNEIKVKKEDLKVFNDTAKWLDIYFEGNIPQIKIPLYMTGTPFQMAVWELLREIPYGNTVTYGELAKIMANRLNKEKMSPQAIGGAVGSNPIGIIVPCHRVIGAGGNLTGYAGGIDKKEKLLKLEGVL